MIATNNPTESRYAYTPALFDPRAKASRKVQPLVWEKPLLVVMLLIIAGGFQRVVPTGLWDPLNLLVYAIGMLLVLRDLEGTVITLFRNPLLFGLLLLAVASVLWSENPTRTVMRSVGLVMLTLIAAYVARNYTLREVLIMIAWTMGFSVVLSFIFSIGLPVYGQRGAHWVGIFSQKNVLGRMMAFSAIVFLTLPTKTTGMFILRLVFYAASAILIIMANSMTSILILAIVTMTSFLYRILWLGGIPFTATIIASVFPAIIGLIFVTSIDVEAVLNSVGRDATLTGRANVWANVTYAIGEKPILGYGYGGFFNNWTGTFGTLWSQRSRLWIAGSSHNTYLDITVQLGIVGFTLFILGALRVLWQTFDYARRVKYSVGLFPILFMTFVISLSFSEDFALYQSLFWFTYLLLGFSFTLYGTGGEQDPIKPAAVSNDLNTLGFDVRSTQTMTIPVLRLPTTAPLPDMKQGE